MSKVGWAKFMATIASLMVLGIGISGSTTLALRWMTDGWSPMFPLLITLDVTALVVGCVLVVWLVLRDDKRRSR